MEKTLKRLLSFVVAVVMVLGMVPFSGLEVFADTETEAEWTDFTAPTADGGTAYCEACYKQARADGMSVEEAKLASLKPWTAYTNQYASTLVDSVITQNPMTTAGEHFFMLETGLMPVSGTAEVGKTAFFYYSTADSCFNLNGQEIARNSKKECTAFSTTAKLNIMDSVGTGSVSVYNNNGADKDYAGSVVQINSTSAEVNLYGGNFKRGAGGNGVAIRIGSQGGTINMYDGVTIDDSLSKSSRSGSCVSVGGSSGKPAVFNMYGGEMKSTTAGLSSASVGHYGDLVTVGALANSSQCRATFNMYGGKIHSGNYITAENQYNNRGSGGLIAVARNCTFNMYGGELSDGYTSECGGAVFLRLYSTMNMYGGKITNCGANQTGYSGATEQLGGGVYVSQNAKLNVYGGSITGNTATKGGNNIYAVSADDVNIYSGTIGDDPSAWVASDTCHVTVKSGDDWVVTEQHKWNSEGCEICSFTLDADSNTYCEACYKQHLEANPGDVAGARKASFKTWSPLDANDAKEYGNVLSGHGGKHYYLDADYTEVTKQRFWRYYGSSSGYGVLCVNLNGHKVTKAVDHDPGEVFSVDNNCTLNIMDSEGTAVVTGRATNKADRGSAIFVNKGTMNIYGGTFRRTDEVEYHPTVTVAAAGTLNIYGGTFDGRLYDAADVTKLSTQSRGWNFRIYGTMNLYNAETIWDSHQNILADMDGVINIAGHTYNEGVEVTAPDCDDEGYKLHTCTDADCEGPYTTYYRAIEATGHTIEAVEQKPATCTEAGYEAHYKCSVCGQLFSDAEGETKISEPEAIDALDHDWSDWEKVDDDTHKRVCQNDNSHVETKAHEWNNGEVTDAPTCTAEGVKTYTCTAEDCGATYTEPVSKVAHSFPNTWIDCEDGKNHKHTCTSCETETETKPHSYGEWANGKQACKDCGYEVSCAHSEKTNSVKTPATCTEAGEMSYHCPTCNLDWTEEIEATGHDTVAEEAKAPTCTEKGHNAYVRCTKCDYTTYEEVSETGHKYMYKQNGAEGHTKYCGNQGCDVSTNESHDGNETCVCGYTAKTYVAYIDGSNGTDPNFAWDEGEVRFETLQEAIDSLETNATEPSALIGLLTDIELTERVNVSGGRFALVNTAGYDITGDIDDSYGMLYISPNAVLALADYNAMGSQTVTSQISNTGITVGNYGTFVSSYVEVTGGDAALYNFYYNGTTFGAAILDTGTVVGTIWNCGLLHLQNDAAVAYIDNSGYLNIPSTATVSELYMRDGSDAAELEKPGTVAGMAYVTNVDYDEENYKLDTNEDGETILVAKNYVAEVNGVKYESLAEAIAAGGEVKLLTDIEITTSIKITNTVTVDLNGQKLTGPDDGKANWYAFIVDGGDLTLKDSVGTGELYAKCYGVETKSGSFTMESGKITATQNKTVGSAVVNYGGTVTINGGTLAAADNAVYTGGYFSDAATTIYDVTIEEGVVAVADYADKAFTEAVSANDTYEVPEDYKWVEQDGIYVLTAKTYVAEVNGTQYESLAEAVEAAADGDTIKLIANVVVPASGVEFNKNLTLDLNNCDITSTGDVFVVSAGTLTITGDGVITANTDDDGTACAIFACGGNVVVKGGTYSCGQDVTYGTDHSNDTIYAKNGSIITIEGGKFIATENVWLLNLKDNSGSAIKVTAGTFVGFNPYNNASEGQNTNFVVDGKHATDADGDGTYEIDVHSYTGKITTPPTTEHEGVKTFTCTCGDSYTEVMPVLPQATVTDKGATTYAGSYYIFDVATGNLTSATGGINLPKTLVFTAQDEGEAAENNYYADFNTDFYVKLDGLSAETVKGTGCYLAGYYAAFEAWVVIPLDNVDIQNGIAYPLLAIAGWDFSYEMICNGVKEFTCGLYLSDEFMAANPGVQVTVDLGLREEQIKDLTELENLEYFESEGFEYDKEDLDVELVAEVGGVKYYSLAEAVAAAKAGETVKLLADIELTEGITIAAGKEIVLDLNGKTISGTDTTNKSFSLITNKGNLTVKDSAEGGKITLTATQDTGYNRYSSVISNSVGGKLTVESGTIEHLGGHTMAYAIDNLTNGKGTYAETVINGGTIKSSYVGIRQFLNGVEADNILTVNGGTVTGNNTSIFFQDPSKNCNSGKLVVSENATLGNRIYVSGTAGTPWDVEIAVSAQALGTYGITTDEIPATSVLKEEGGVYGFVEAVASVNGEGYASLQEAIDAAGEGETVTILADIELTEGVVVAAGKVLTLDLNGKTVSYEDASGAAAQTIKNAGDLTIDDSIGGGKITFNSTTPSSNNGYSTSTIINIGNLTISGGTIENTTASGPSYAIDNAWYTQDVSLTINDGTITATKIAVRQVPFSTTYKNVVNVNGGTLTGATAGLQVHNYAANATLSEVNISGGTFNGSYAFYTSFSNAVNSGNTEIDISGGTFNGYLYLYNGNAGSAAKENVFEATVTGGTFNGGTYIYAADAEDNDVDLRAISGGTFANDVTVNCVPGYKAEKNDAGTYGIVAKENVKAWNVQTGVEYATVAEALNAAVSGQTVKLVADDEVIYQFIKVGVTLDLNGHELTATYLAADFAGTYIIDSTDGDGLLVMDLEGTLTLNKTNTYMPIKTAEGYRFYKAGLDTEYYSEKGHNDEDLSDGRILLNFAFDYDNNGLANALKATGGVDENVKVRILMSWTNESGSYMRYYYYTAEDVMVVAGNHPNKVFTLTVTGTQSVSQLQITAEMILVDENGTPIMTFADAPIIDYTK